MATKVYASFTILAMFFSGQSFGVEPKMKAWEQFKTIPEKIDCLEIDMAKNSSPSGRFMFLMKEDVNLQSVKVSTEEVQNSLVRQLSGVRGVAGGKLQQAGASSFSLLGKITLRHEKGEFEIGVSDTGFVMGPGLPTDANVFHSWTLAKILHQAGREHGNGLTQRAFNILSGATWITGEQLRTRKIDEKRYHEREARIWDFLPVEFAREDVEAGEHKVRQN